MADWTIKHLDETDSTNRWLREHGGEHDMVVCTDYQTAGRGCGTNSWESERGQNLLFSVLVHPEAVRAADQFILSMANALALSDTLDSYIGSGNDEGKGKVKIKWPNDIYWNDYKICGTLIETTLKGPFVKDCIIGTGINVNQRRFVSDAPNPMSLRQILERVGNADTVHDTDREEVLQKVLDNLSKYMAMVRTGQWEDIRALYRQHLYRWQETWPYRFADGSVKDCKLVNVSDDGHLELLCDGHRPYSLAFKEVQFVVQRDNEVTR